MTHTDTLRRALRAYDLAGPETPERTAALDAVLSAAHGVCARVCTFCDGSGKSDGHDCICQVIGLPPEPPHDLQCGDDSLANWSIGSDR